MSRLTDVVKNLIIINVIAFGAQMVLTQHVDVSMGYLHFPLSSDFKPFQIFTSMFMHADVRHLFFNMLSLFFLGPIVEQTLGGKRFLILYLLSGLVGSLAHFGINFYEYYQLIGQINPEMTQQLITEGKNIILDHGGLKNPVWNKFIYVYHGSALGASGAVYGAVIAFVTMFPKRKLMIFPIPIPISAYIIGIGMVLYGVISGVGSLQPGIAHFAHLGGAITGFIMIHYWKMANLR